MPQGRHPKPAHMRQNKTKKSSHTELAAPDRPKVPKLPNPDGREWHKLTRDWWRDVWRSPMASEYLDADIPGLARLALMIDEFNNNPDSKILAEIRLQETRFGLSPLDRSRLQWQVAKGEEAGRKRKQTSKSEQTNGKPSKDPRDNLRIVG